MQKKKIVAPAESAPPPVIPAAQPVVQPAEPSTPKFAGMQQSIMEEPTAPPTEVPATAPAVPTVPIALPPAEAPPIPQPVEIPPEPEELATLPEPQLPVAQLAYNRTNIEEIESLIESVVEEKWRQAMESLGDMNMWKEKARTEIISIKQELLRLEQRFESMEKALVGRVHEYDKHILNIGAEIKAMEKVLQKIMQPLSKNVKELDRITKILKK